MESTKNRTLLMGICNVTPDSFSDGGKYFHTDAAIARAHQMVSEGAHIIDVGGESTRPGSVRLTAEAELQRIRDVVVALVKDGITVSVDTMHAQTAQVVAEIGAHIINDVSGGLADPRMYQVVAANGCDYVCQHWRGDPATMDQLTDYDGDVVGGVIAELRQRTDALLTAGVNAERIIWDPGLGFAKTAAGSWALLGATGTLVRESPSGRVLVGASRKRFLTSISEGGAQVPGAAHERDLATAATTVVAVAGGAWAVRVHNILTNAAALRCGRTNAGQQMGNGMQADSKLQVGQIQRRQR
ncbi:MAG: dihydropteroate synthase [Actinomycetaceae bacterium]|nr:dihydropteroate synthase [Actinomycetaceae bacterium]